MYIHFQNTRKMNSIQEIILLFTKYPLAGKSKTRLIPSLGPQGAADLQSEMTLFVTAELENYSRQYSCPFQIHYAGGTLDLMQEWLGTDHSYKAQCRGGLGNRMAHAISTNLGSSRSIILVGSDCPDIDETILKNGFSALDDNNIVLGPAFDGGYYLIGVQGDLAEESLNFLFSNIDWGGTNVLSQTLSRIKKLQLSCHLLKKLHDIDTPEDLRHLNNYPYPQ